MLVVELHKVARYGQAIEVLFLKRTDRLLLPGSE